MGGGRMKGPAFSSLARLCSSCKEVKDADCGNWVRGKTECRTCVNKAVSKAREEFYARKDAETHFRQYINQRAS